MYIDLNKYVQDGVNKAKILGRDIFLITRDSQLELIYFFSLHHL